MKTFEYVALASSGESVRGRAQAQSELALDRELEDQGLTLAEVRAVKPRAGRERVRLTRAELATFTTQLATLLGAGIPLAGALEDIARRMRSATGKRAVEAILADLKDGVTLGDALDAQPHSFPVTYRTAVRGGELSGTLKDVLPRLSAYLEQTRSLRASAMEALVYPVALVGAVMALLVVLLTFLLPRIVDALPAGRGDLPAETRWMLAASDALTVHVGWIAAALGIAVVFVTLAWRRPGVREQAARLLVSCPRVGDVARMIACSRFAWTAATLQHAGCDAFTTLRTAGQTCGNAWLARAVRHASHRVRAGLSMTEALDETGAMDPTLLQLTGVGERSGELCAALRSAAEYYDVEIPRAVSWLRAWVEPVLWVGAGLVVACVLMSSVLPVFTL